MTALRRLLDEDPIRALPIVIITALIYWFIRKSLHKRRFGADFKEIRKKAWLNETIRLLLICWTAELVCCTMMPTGFWWKFWHPWSFFRADTFSFFRFTKWKVVPVLWTHFVKFSGDYLIKDFQWQQLILDFSLNVVLYMPLGLALPFVWKRANFGRTVLVGFIVTLIVEFYQAFIFRDPNIDDVICNTLGAAVGYLVYLAMKKVLPRFTEKCMVKADKELAKCCE